MGFTLSQDEKTFYFMDDLAITNKLARVKDTNMLMEVGELYIKDRDKPNFKIYEFVKYPMIYFSDTYLMQESKIFYLYKDKPLENGILDME
jgi:hypothetical protein